LIEQRKLRGFDVKGFCVTPLGLNCRWLPFPELDYRWKKADRALMQMYEELAGQLHDRDVLVLYNGANLHPDFVRQMDILKVYTAGDDPESTEILTKPCAPSFDIHLVNNIACVEMYRQWGLRNVHFWPLGSLSEEQDIEDLSENSILEPQQRTIPIIYIGEKNRYKAEILERLHQTFPDAFWAGRGWSRGRISDLEMTQLYRKSQIGWNVHNSTGPINFRTYELSAYGVMQICDNKSHLKDIYALGKEAVGFDSVEECIDLTQYYLHHKEEQRVIALNGWKRWKKDYTPDRVWDRLVDIVDDYRRNNPGTGAHSADPIILQGYLSRVSSRNTIFRPLTILVHLCKSFWQLLGV
jgi:hypothetical protein